MPVPWQAVEHGIKRDFRFQACKGSTQAEVDSTPESDVAIWLPLNVEAIGIGELSFVAVRRANPGHDHVTWLDALVANHRLGCRHARHSFHWRVIAQGLLDGPRHKRAIFSQTFNYARILVEAEDHIAEQVGRCLVTRDQQQAAEAEQFHVAQSLPIDLSSKQRTDQIVLRMLAALLKYLCEIAIHALDLLEECLAILLRIALITSNNGIGPAFEILAQLYRD